MCTKKALGDTERHSGGRRETTCTQGARKVAGGGGCDIAAGVQVRKNRNQVLQSQTNHSFRKVTEIRLGNSLAEESGLAIEIEREEEEQGKRTKEKNCCKARAKKTKVKCIARRFQDEIKPPKKLKE